MSRPVVRTHILLKMAEHPMQHGELCAYICHRSFERSSEFQCGTAVYLVFITGQREKIPSRDMQNEDQNRADAQPRETCSRLESKRSDNQARGDPLHDLPELLQEFTENFVGREASTIEAAGPPEPSFPEPLLKVEFENHNLCLHISRKTEVAK